MTTKKELFACLLLKSSESIHDYLKIAFEEFGADGVESIHMNESEVDALLGDRAYSGGDLDDELLDQVSKLENEWQKLFFYDGDDSLLRAKECMKKLETLGADLRYLEEESADWSETWKKYYKPISISDKLRVLPAWMVDIRETRDILINPGRGFGTGGHETTYLCLKLFEELNFKKGKLCLDFGCGSGILGIAAIKQYEMICDLVDIDTHALENTLQNLNLNFNNDELNGHALVLRDRFILKDKYELVFANILAHVLIDESQLLKESLKEEGHLILSGILSDQTEMIKDHYKSLGLKFINEEFKGDWAAVHFQK